jgi:hypothetical protein
VRASAALILQERMLNMAKYTAVAAQTVAANQNVILTNDVIGCRAGNVLHRADSGIVTLKGMTRTCFARYRVSFGANIAIPTGGTVGPISVALTINGEIVGSAIAIVTPAAVEEFFHVSLDDYIDVPCGCCVSLAVRNVSEDDITVQNANLIITREA